MYSPRDVYLTGAFFISLAQTLSLFSVNAAGEITAWLVSLVCSIYLFKYFTWRRKNERPVRISEALIFGVFWMLLILFLIPSLPHIKAVTGGAWEKYNFARLYIDGGNGIKPNAAEAEKWMKKAAEEDDAIIQTAVGWTFLGNHGFTPNYSEAEKWLLKAAEQGISEAQYNLGVMNLKGLGMSQNNKKAAEWFRKAAEQDILSVRKDNGTAFSRAFERSIYASQSALGLLYLQGMGVPQDYSEAVKWLKKGSAGGDPAALLGLGSAYENGHGVAQDYAEAEKLYRQASDRGLIQGYLGLGDLYKDGKGVVQDYTQAAKYYRIAAEGGDSEAQLNLGKLYEDGLGVSQSYEEAYFWYSLASKTAHNEAIAARDKVNGYLSPAQSQNIVSRVLSWKATQSQ